MPLRYLNGEPLEHPITELAYPCDLEDIRFGNKILRIQSIPDVERAIDLVFSWLEGKGLRPEEIEHLAPYFGTVWPSALALGQRMSELGEAGKLSGKRVLEVGCGLGVPGLVASMYGAKVAMSDGHPDVPRFLSANIALNGDPEIDFLIPEWATGAMPRGDYDFVIASDVLYELPHAQHFSKVMIENSGKNTQIILTDPGRAYIQRFVNEMNRLGWDDLLTPWTVRHRGSNVDVFLINFVTRFENAK